MNNTAIERKENTPPPGNPCPPNAGLYVHVPFCRKKCFYCGFFSVPSPTLIRPWIDALLKEIPRYRWWPGRFDTLYFGGGTPSLLDIQALEAIMLCLRAHFPFSLDTEITLEANPCDLTPEKIQGLRRLNINRISLGVQSFDPRALAFLGRTHTVSDAETAIRRLMDAGFENLTIDLMYGFREQSLQDWQETLQRALSFEPAHLSCYQLTVEPHTCFWKRVHAGRLLPIDEEEARTQFLFTSRFLEAHGYLHYEISSFARDERCYARHNWKYWTHAPYLGLGPAAHSFLRGKRWWNVRSVRRYIHELNAGAPPIAASETLSEEQLALEAMALGMRTSRGVSLHTIGSGQANPHLSRFMEEGFLKMTRGRVLPTRKGFLIADYLPTCLTA